MIELVEAVDELSFIEGTCLLKGDTVVTTTFPADKRNHETIVKKAFIYVFQSASRLRTQHDEAHLEIGDKRMSGFLLEDGSILICMSSKGTNVANVRNNVRELKNGFLQEESMREAGLASEPEWTTE